MIRSPYPLADNAAKTFAGEHSAFYIDSNSVLYYMGTRAADMMSGGVVGKMNKLMENVKSVSMQEGTALIITNDGKLYGWGENAYNQIATGLAVTQLVPVLKAETCTAAGAGMKSTLKDMEDMLFEDLRIDEEELMKMDPQTVRELSGLYGSSNVRLFARILGRMT